MPDTRDITTPASDVGGLRTAQRDLRFVTGLSAGLVSTTLAIGAVCTPLIGWHGLSARLSPHRDAVVRLAPAPVRAMTRGHARPTAAAFAAEVPPASVSTGRPLEAAGIVVVVAGRDARRFESPARTRRDRLVRRPRPERSLLGPAAGIRSPIARDADVDADGLPDAWERRHGLDPQRAADAVEDDDGDGLPNLVEFQLSSLPRRADSNADGIGDGDDDADGDGLRNAVEVRAKSNPRMVDTDRDGVADPQDDDDGDGLAAATEQALGSDPGLADSDGDGLLDGQPAADADGLSDEAADTVPQDSNGEGTTDTNDDGGAGGDQRPEPIIPVPDSEPPGPQAPSPEPVDEAGTEEEHPGASAPQPAAEMAPADGEQQTTDAAPSSDRAQAPPAEAVVEPAADGERSAAEPSAEPTPVAPPA